MTSHQNWEHYKMMMYGNSCPVSWWWFLGLCNDFRDTSHLNRDYKDIIGRVFQFVLLRTSQSQVVQTTSQLNELANHLSWPVGRCHRHHFFTNSSHLSFIYTGPRWMFRFVLALFQFVFIFFFFFLVRFMKLNVPFYIISSFFACNNHNQKLSSLIFVFIVEYFLEILYLQNRKNFNKHIYFFYCTIHWIWV